MSEGATTITELNPTLLKEAKEFSLVDDKDASPTNARSVKERKPEQSSPVTELGEEDEDDLVVYSDTTALKTVDDISRQFESETTELTLRLEKRKKDSVPAERHEVRLALDDGETPVASESTRLVESRVAALLHQEEPINSFQDVPLLNSNPDGLFFNGLVFCDTVDSLYRPVVVINTRAIPHKSLRSAALKHLREALEPVVSTGPYVLIFTSFTSSSLSKLPVSWVLAAYKELSYPFKKNVQHVILVRPNKLLKALVRIMKLVVKKKAHSKVKQILYLGDVESVTNGEVTLEHLSPKVIGALGPEELTYSDVSNVTT